jgi:methionyl-tRNA formyltransferase
MLQHEIDTGNLIMQKSISIDEDENVGSVHDRLMLLGATLVTQTVDVIIDADCKGEALRTTPQKESADLRPAPKIFKDTCMIDFSWDATRICNHVRGLSPYPGAWIGEIPTDHALADVLKGAKVYKVEITNQSDVKGHIILPCSGGYVDIIELQLPGKKRMNASALLNGLKNK